MNIKIIPIRRGTIAAITTNKATTLYFKAANKAITAAIVDETSIVE